MSADAIALANFALMMDAYSAQARVPETESEVAGEDEGEEEQQDAEYNTKKQFGKDFDKKVPVFGGDAEEYGNWSFKVKMGIKSIDPKALQILEFIELDENIVNLDKLKKTYKIKDGFHIEKLSAELYEVLGLKLEGAALTMIRNVMNFNGIEAWRILPENATVRVLQCA